MKGWGLKDVWVTQPPSFPLLCENSASFRRKQIRCPLDLGLPSFQSSKRLADGRLFIHLPVYSTSVLVFSQPFR